MRQLAVAVLRDRMRRVLREKMGAAYSPLAIYRTVDAYDGFGFVLMEAGTSRAMADEAARVMASLAADLAKTGVGADELDRMRKPLLTAWRSRSQEGAKAHHLILSELVSGKPNMLWNAEYGALVEKVTAEEVSRACAELFSVEPARQVILAGENAKAAPRPAQGQQAQQTQKGQAQRPMNDTPAGATAAAPAGAGPDGKSGAGN